MTLSQLMEKVDAEPRHPWKIDLIRKWIRETRTVEEYCYLEDITPRHEKGRDERIPA